MFRILFSIKNVEILAAALAFRGFWYITSLVLALSMTVDAFGLYSKSIMEMQVGGILLAGGFYQVISIRASKNTDLVATKKLYVTCIVLILATLSLVLAAMISFKVFAAANSPWNTTPTWWAFGAPYSILLTMQGYYTHVNKFRPLLLFNVAAVLIAFVMSYTLLSNYHENGAALGVSVGLAASAIASMAYSRMLNIGITMNDVRKLFIEIRLSSTVVLINNLLLPFSLLLSANLLASNGDLRQVGILNFSYSIFALTLFAANALTAKDISEPSHLPAADTVQLLKFIIEKIVRNLSFLSISFAAVLLISASIFLSSGSAIISQSWQTSATFFLVGIIFCIQLPITTLLYQSGKEVHLLIASIVWFAVVIGLTTMVQVQSAQTVGLIYAIGYTVYLSIVGYMFYLNQFEK